MTSNFLSDAELESMSLPAVMRMAVSLSGLSDAAVIARMGWSASYGYRVLRPHDDLWPALPSLPRLCGVLGTAAPARWLELQARVAVAQEQQPEARPLTVEGLSAELVELFVRVGAVAREGQASVRDGRLSMEEARMLRGRVEDTMRLCARLLDGLVAVGGKLAAERRAEKAGETEVLQTAADCAA